MLTQIIRKKIRRPDLRVGGGGTVYTVTPETSGGKDWIDEHVGHGEGTTWLGPSLIVEHRFISDLVDGAIGDGLVVA